MNLIQKYATKSDCYKCGRTIVVKGLMLHSVGCNQPDPEVFYNIWNKAGHNVCPQAVIGTNGKVIQTLPWNHRGWHGGGKSNDTHIGVEMTEPATIKYSGGANWTEKSDGANTRAHVMSTYKTAVELFAYLCKMFKLNPLADGVIISHSEGHKRGIATAHADVEHIWSHYGLTMDKFRKDVKDAMGGVSSSPTSSTVATPSSGAKYYVRLSASDKASQIGAFNVLDNAKKLVDQKPAYCVYDASGNCIYSKNKNSSANTGNTGASHASSSSYLVKVTANVLNIRNGSGVYSAVVGQITDKGTYTIVETKGNWGRLKSGKGWICLDYTKRV